MHERPTKLVLERQRPWRAEADLIEASGRSRADAINLVIIEWLMKGHIEPLIDAIGTGDVVDPVLSAIALMLKPDKRLPYYLALRRTPGKLGASARAGILVRDTYAALRYEQRSKEVGSERALKEVADEFRIGEKTISRAVTRHRKAMQAIDPPTLKKS